MSGPAELARELVASNVAYIIVTVLLVQTLGWSYGDFTAAWQGTANMLFTGWVAFGGLLGVIDFLAVASLFSDLT